MQELPVRFTQNPPSETSIGAYYKSEDYISHTDSSKGLINRMYRFVRNFSLNQKKKLVEKETGLKNGHLLDVGSGTGHFASAMQKAAWKVTGLEPDEGARAVASKEHSLNLLPSGELFNLPEKKFNAITLWHVLEHVHDVKKYIQTFKKLLTDTGRLFIAVPNYTSYDAEKYKEYWAAYDVPRHLYHFSPNSIRVLTEKHGFKVDSIKPMWFDSFYVSMLSEKYKKNGSIGLIKAVWNGFISNANAVSDTGKCSSLIYVIRRIT